jgi:hypothetical protein
MSTLTSGQATGTSVLVPSRAFGDLSDAPAPEVGKTLGWNSNGDLANVEAPPRAFGDLTDAPTPEVGKALGWDSNGDLANIVAPATYEVVWDDIIGPAVQASGNAALTQEGYRDTPAILLFMRHDQDDALTFTFQMSHRWMRDSEVRVHCHYIPMVTPATNQNVRLVCRYAWAHSATEVPVLTSWGTATVDIPIPSSGADTFKEKLYTLFATTPTGSKESSILIVSVTRNGTSASDSFTTGKSGGTQTANFCLLTVDAHYQTDKNGTTTEIPA